MYHCQVCTATVPPRTPQRRHPVLRRDGTISGELTVCPDCARYLDLGWAVARVRQERAPKATPSPLPAPLEARLHLPVAVGEVSQETDWRDSGIRTVLQATQPGGTGSINVKPGLYLRFRRNTINEWQFGVGVKATRMDLLDAVEHVKRQMG